MGRGEDHEWNLPRDPSAAGHARRLISRTCSELPGQRLNSLLLLTSEIVTNAVRHGSGNISLRLRCDRDGAEVEVLDEDPQLPTLGTPSLAQEDGRGLTVVDAVADAWGTRPTRSGKAVWFRVNASRGHG